MSGRPRCDRLAELLQLGVRGWWGAEGRTAGRVAAAGSAGATGGHWGVVCRTGVSAAVGEVLTRVRPGCGEV